MVQFNQIQINPEDIESYLKQEFQLREICEEILHQRIVLEAAASRKLAVSEPEIEAMANEIRCSQHLEKAADTIAWLRENLMDADVWQEAITKHLLADKLAKHLFDHKVESYFAQNRLTYDRFIVYQLIVPYEKLARELFYQIDEEEISFYQAAHLYDIDPQRRYVCGYMGEVHRWDYSPDVAAVLFQTPIELKTVIGPIQTEKGYHLFQIEEYMPAELTAEIREEIIETMFGQWLDSELNYMIHRDSHLAS